MSMSIKTAALAFGVMAGLGTAAPLVAYYANQPGVQPTMARSIKSPARPAKALVAATVAEETTMDELVIASPPAAAALPAPAMAPVERTCRWHANETLATGRVWVCDVPRTSNERPRGTFEIEHETEQLAPRDAPSPSGFLD